LRKKKLDLWVNFTGQPTMGDVRVIRHVGHSKMAEEPKDRAYNEEDQGFLPGRVFTYGTGSLEMVSLIRTMQV